MTPAVKIPLAFAMLAWGLLARAGPCSDGKLLHSRSSSGVAPLTCDFSVDIKTTATQEIGSITSDGKLNRSLSVALPFTNPV